MSLTPAEQDILEHACVAPSVRNPTYAGWCAFVLAQT